MKMELLLSSHAPELIKEKDECCLRSSHGNLYSMKEKKKISEIFSLRATGQLQSACVKFLMHFMYYLQTACSM